MVLNAKRASKSSDAPELKTLVKPIPIKPPTNIAVEVAESCKAALIRTSRPALEAPASKLKAAPRRTVPQEPRRRKRRSFISFLEPQLICFAYKMVDVANVFRYTTSQHD
jgi:hypothetical protein